MKTIVTVYGTRPEAIKLAPVIRELEKSPSMTPYLVTTGQHRSMLDQVNRAFDIHPQTDLDIHKPQQSLTWITTEALNGVTQVLDEVSADAVLVQGDTTTTFAASLAAFYRQIPVIHLEAGLRTDNRYSPFPEEINRRLVGELASLHLTPTHTASANLLRAGVARSAICCTGNTVIDALLWAVERSSEMTGGAVEEIEADPRRVVLVTAHRRESWGTGMSDIGRALRQLARWDPELLIVFPIHKNPVVRQAITPHTEALPNVRLLEPLEYLPFARLMARADLILTDSGGIQEEAPSLGKPVLVMRENTERPEAVEAGAARLVGTSTESIVSSAQEILTEPSVYASMSRAINPYGDGKAAGRCVSAISSMLLGTPMPEEFVPRTHDPVDQEAQVELTHD